MSYGGDMRMVQGWSGLQFSTKRMYLPESPNYQSFPRYSPFTVTFFFVIVVSYWWQQHKLFCPDVQDITSEFISKVSLLLGGPSLVKNHWGLRQVKVGRRVVYDFLAHFFPMLLYEDKHCHTGGWWSLTISRSFLLNSFMHIIPSKFL